MRARTLPRKLLVGVIAALIMATCVLGAAASPLASEPAAAAPTVDSPLGRVGRVFVFSVPTLSWADLGDQAPNLSRILKGSAVADLAVRSVARKTTASDGYATLNAGTRSRGSTMSRLAFAASTRRSGSSDPDGDPINPPPPVFSPEPANDDDATFGVFSSPGDEPAEAPQPEPPPDGTPGEYRASGTAEEFARRTGAEPRIGEIFNFGLVSMLQINDALFYDSEIGALGDALANAGIGRAVIANGDHPEGPDVDAYRREASVALMDHNGIVQGGRVGHTLLRTDPQAPFSTRYDQTEVEASFKEFWKPRSVVLVEGSDLVRFEDFKALATEGQRDRLHEAAIRSTDELFGQLLKSVDLSRDAVVIAAPWAADQSNSLTVFGIHAPGVKPGLLSSGTTRRDGFVQTVDIAPTLLSMLNVKPPTSMEGTQMRRAGTGGSYADRTATFIDADRGAKFRDRLIGPVTTVFVVLQLVLWAGAAIVITRYRGVWPRRVVETATLTMLLFLPMTFVAGLLPFYRYGEGAYWCFILGTPAVLAAIIYRLVGQRFTGRSIVDALLVGLGSIVGFFTVDVIIGAPLQFNTVFGYTPTVAGRFAGIGNPAFSMLAAAGILLSVLVAYRVSGRNGLRLGVAVLVWCLLLDGLPFWGSDVGGALTLVPVVGIVACMLLGYRVRIRTALMWIVGAVVVTLGFGLLDLTRPPESRSHLGRLMTDISNNGPEAFRSVVIRKLDANLSVVTSSVWTLMVPVAFVFVAYAMWRAPGHMRRIAEIIPQERAAVLGLLVAMVLGFALNDSGISVPGLMLGVANASLIHLLLRVQARGADDQLSLFGGEQSVRS